MAEDVFTMYIVSNTGEAVPDSTFTFRVDEDLKAAFAELASEQERTSAQLLRVLMGDAVERWRDAREHDRWFRNQVEQAVVEADDPALQRTPHDEVRSTWHRQRAELEQRASGKTG
jgi:predicted transcriptional regulator